MMYDRVIRKKCLKLQVRETSVGFHLRVENKLFLHFACHTIGVERSSMECSKSKTNVITLANHKDADNPVNQSKLLVITCS